jgi:hypothetical protein
MIDGEKVVGRSAHQIVGMAWSPDGQRLAYVDGPELKEWPSGRRAALPKAWLQGDTDDGFTWRVRWKPDGRQLVVIYGREAAVVLDARTFRVTKGLSRVSAVWWHGDRLCWLPAESVQGYDIRRDQRNYWFEAGQKRWGPRGVYLVDVSAGGEALLGRLAEIKERNSTRVTFEDTVVIARTPNGGIRWRSRMGDDGCMNLFRCDSIEWSSMLGAAAVSETADTGQSYGSTQVATRRGVPKSSLDDRGPNFAEGPPSWCGRRVLALALNSVVNRPPSQRLILLDPRTFKVETLLERFDNLLLSAAGTRSGARFAYSRRRGKGSEVVVAETAKARARAKRWTRVLPEGVYEAHS